MTKKRSIPAQRRTGPHSSGYILLLVLVGIALGAACTDGTSRAPADSVSESSDPTGPDDVQPDPAGHRPEDAWITTMVKMQLLLDEVVDGWDINVDTLDGRVTLHGQTTSDSARSTAERLAGDVDGVQSVRNLLTVVSEADAGPTTEARVSDEDVRSRVETAVNASTDLQSVDVQSVQAGVVTLAGEVDTLGQRRRALAIARRVDGVVGVVSRLDGPDELGDTDVWGSAYPDAAGFDATLADAWITSKVKVALMVEPGLSPFDVNVDTRDGVVTLFGTVDSEEARSTAGLRVAEVEGVQRVDNQLQIVPEYAAERVDAHDDDLASAVRERLTARALLEDASIDVQVENRVARLTGVVHSHRARLAALTVARGTAGITAVIDDLAVSTDR